MLEVQDQPPSYTSTRGENEMSCEPAPTIESFYQFCAQKKLMGIRCKRCGEVSSPPRPRCSKCNSAEMEWTQLKGTGTLLTYSVIQVTPTAFQALVPYTVGIVELAEGPRLPAMIRVPEKELKIGLALKVAFDEPCPGNWPSWTRYHFVKADVL